MRHLPLTLAAAALACTEAAHALSLDASYLSDQERDSGFASSGFSAGLSQGLGEHFFVSASYSRMRTETFDDGGLTGSLEYVSAGIDLGASASLSDRFGLSASVGYAGSETRGLGGFRDDPDQRADGPVGALNLSMRPHRRIWLYAGPSYSYIGGVPGWQTTAGARWRMARTLWLNGGFWRGEVTEGWSAGLSADFGSN